MAAHITGKMAHVRLGVYSTLHISVSLGHVLALSVLLLYSTGQVRLKGHRSIPHLGLQ